MASHDPDPHALSRLYPHEIPQAVQVLLDMWLTEAPREATPKETIQRCRQQLYVAAQLTGAHDVPSIREHIRQHILQA